jgi:hypothetical protein
MQKITDLMKECADCEHYPDCKADPDCGELKVCEFWSNSPAMEGQNPPTMADTIECESDLISMKEHEIAALKAEVERLKEKYTEVLEENRSLRKANLSFGPAQIKLQREIKDLIAEVNNFVLSVWDKALTEVNRNRKQALKGGK